MVDAHYSLIDDDCQPWTTSRECWADLVKMDGKTAQHAYGLALRGLENIGCPSYSQEAADFAMYKAEHPDDHFCRKPPYFKNYCNTTDAGSDEAKHREMAAFVLSSIVWCLFWETNCYLHQLHLIMKVLFAQIDIMLVALNCPHDKYFSALSVLSNSLRECSAKVRKGWLTLFPDMDDVKTIARKIAPKCLSGRWGATTEFEKYLAKIPWDKLHAVVKYAFGISDAPEPEPTAAAAPAPSRNTPFDEVAADETKEYKKKIGKWRKASVNVTKDSIFRIVLDGVFKIHELMMPNNC